MYQHPDVIWLNTCPTLLRFNLPIIKYLSHYQKIAQWEYQQHQDEASCLNVALNLLDDYLTMIPKSVHLVGHSTCGLLGLLYARKYPEKVKSLSLLGVGVNPSLDWVNYYYFLRKTLPCSRELVLAKMVKHLFGYQSNYHSKALVKLLDKALFFSLSPHSLYQAISIATGGISAPLLICGNQNDGIISTAELEGWYSFLKNGDRLAKVKEGHHFFHYFQPQKVGEILIRFWESQAKISTTSSIQEENLLSMENG